MTKQGATFRGVLARLQAGHCLSESECGAAIEQILRGEVEAVLIASFLSLLAARPGGPTVDEIVGGARAMRRFVTAVPTPRGSPVVDTCGTGGAAKTFNVSTAAAIVAAAAAPGKIRVAKHGGRSRTGRGSAEVLAQLGVNVEAAPEVQAACLEQIGLSFSFAVRHHPAMKYAAPVRLTLGFPTIINLLGPLSNPAGATHQIIGVHRADLALRVAEAGARLGSTRVLVVHGDDGSDELTVAAANTLHDARGGSPTTARLDARDYGMPRARTEEMAVSSLEEAAGAVREVLEDRPGPRRDIVVLNAAGALVVSGVAAAFADGVALAREAIREGRAARTLEQLVTLSGGAA